MLKAFEDFRRRLKLAQKMRNPNDLITANPNSDLINCKQTNKNRIVFNIGANKYRLICGYLFKNQTCILFVKFVGTHNEYDKIDICKINMFKS
jgi:mRNA interferase HigB